MQEEKVEGGRWQENAPQQQTTLRAHREAVEDLRFRLLVLLREQEGFLRKKIDQLGYVRIPSMILSLALAGAIGIIDAESEAQIDRPFDAQSSTDPAPLTYFMLGSPTTHLPREFQNCGLAGSVARVGRLGHGLQPTKGQARAWPGSKLRGASTTPPEEIGSVKCPPRNGPKLRGRNQNIGGTSSTTCGTASAIGTAQQQGRKAVEKMQEKISERPQVPLAPVNNFLLSRE